MKMFLKFIFIVIFNCCFINSMMAQTSASEAAPIKKNELNIPPLEVVIDSILKHSAMLSFRKHHIGVKASTLKSERIYWTRNLGLQADVNYGTYDNFSTNGNGQTTSAFSTKSQQFNYSAGFYIKFPIFDLFNRKHQIKLAKLELDEAKSMADFQEEEIRQTVIKLYQDLILKHKLLRIKSRNLGNGRVNMQMVEKEFRNGVVAISEYVRITSMTSNMESDYELAKSNFLIAKQLLEDMAGFVFNVTLSN